MHKSKFPIVQCKPELRKMSQVWLRFSSSQVLLQCFLWSLSFWLSKVAAPTWDSLLDAVGALIVSWPRETKLQSKHIPKGRKVIRSCFLSIYKIWSLAAGWPKSSDTLGLLPGAFASKHLQTGKKGKDGKALMVLPITHPNKGVKHCIVQERKDRQRVLEETRHAVFCDAFCTDVYCKQYQMRKWMQMPIATCWNSCPAARLGNWSAKVHMLSAPHNADAALQSQVWHHCDFNRPFEFKRDGIGSYSW